MDVKSIAPSTKKEENKQIRAAIRNSIFTAAKEHILWHELKTWAAVVKFLRGRRITDLRKLSKDEKKQKDNLKNCLKDIKSSEEEAKNNESSTDKKINDTILMPKSVENNEQEMQVRHDQNSVKKNDKLTTSQQNDLSKEHINVSSKETNNQQPKDKKSETSPALTEEELEKIEEKAKKENENLVKQGFTKEEVETITKNRIEELKNEKLKSLKQLKNIPDGYKLRNVKGDGNCFYRTVAHIAKKGENNYKEVRKFASEVADELIRKVTNLRKEKKMRNDSPLSSLTADDMKKSFGDIPFMDIIYQGFGYAKNGTIETIGDALYVLKRIKESLSKDCKEGGEAELYFISAAIGKPVVIYDNNGNVTGYSPTLSPVLGRFLGQEDISMLGNGKVVVYREGVGDNGHFQALVIAKKDQKNINSNSDKSFVEINNKEKNTERPKNAENPNNSTIKNPSSKGIRGILRKPNDMQSKEKNSHKKVTFDLSKNEIKFFSK